MDTMQIKVALDHDQPLVRAGLTASLAQEPDLALQGGWRACDGLSRLDRDTRVLLLDHDTGQRLAADLAAGGASGAPPCHVMIVTARTGEWDIRQAVASGVRGIHLLDSPLERLLGGVRLLARGQRSFDDTVAARMADFLIQPMLTDREAEVLQQIARGACNKDIARQLGIALGTVKSHARALFDKLGVQSRVQAVVVARRRGLVGQGERGVQPLWA